MTLQIAAWIGAGLYAVAFCWLAWRVWRLERIERGRRTQFIERVRDQVARNHAFRR